MFVGVRVVCVGVLLWGLLHLLTAVLAFKKLARHTGNSLLNEATVTMKTKSYGEHLSWVANKVTEAVSAGSTGQVEER